MGKYIMGAIFGIILMLPVSAFAWSTKQMAQPIVGVDCEKPYMLDPDGTPAYDDNNDKIYDPKGTNGRCSTTVYRFQDGNTKCYVVKGTNAGGIDCLEAL